MKKKMLFICTGNYYRSRFAEELFNHLVEQANLEWEAFSRGFRAFNPGNIGPISIHALEGLKERNIIPKNADQSSQQLEEKDLAIANHIIALKETEHRPYAEAQFPDWVERMEYWQIDDIDVALPEEALVKLEDKVRKLVEKLESEE